MWGFAVGSEGENGGSPADSGEPKAGRIQSPVSVPPGNQIPVGPIRSTGWVLASPRRVLAPPFGTGP